MQDTASVNLHLRPFPAVMCFLSSNRLALPLPDVAWQTRPFSDKCRRRNTHDRKPCPHDNDGRGTSVTAAGKRNFPFVRCVALSIFLWRIAPSHTFLLFLSASPSVCQCPYAAIPDGISGHFRCRGKGKDGIRNTNFCRQNLHTSQAQVVFHRSSILSKKFAEPTP